MVVAYAVYLIAILVFVVLRFVFDAQHPRQLAQDKVAGQPREIKLLGGIGDMLIAAGRPDYGSERVDPFDREDCATVYLERILALTGTKQDGGTFVLDVGTRRFFVRDRHVVRLRDVVDPTCEYEETCFYVPHKGMPTAEQIAIVLLELRRNPALFDRWATRIGAVKADGEVFSDRR